MIIWALGASLLAHVVSYVSVSYFDQNFVNWYLLLAMVAILPSYCSAAKRRALDLVPQGASALSEAVPNWVPSEPAPQFSSTTRDGTRNTRGNLLLPSE